MTFEPHMTALRRLFVALSASAAALSGCGGGGSDATPPAATTYDAATALHNLLTTANTWIDMKGTGSDGLVHELKYSTSPIAPGPFPSASADSARMNLESIHVSGPKAVVETSVYYFDSGSASLAGIERANGQCDVATGNGVAVPANAAVGHFGAVAMFNVFASCATGAAAAGTAILGWSVEADAGTTLFCLNMARFDLAGAALQSERLCSEVAVDGALGARARVALTQVAGNFMLVARNY